MRNAAAVLRAVRQDDSVQLMNASKEKVNELCEKS